MDSVIDMKCTFPRHKFVALLAHLLAQAKVLDEPGKTELLNEPEKFNDRKYAIVDEALRGYRDLYLRAKEADMAGPSQELQEAIDAVFNFISGDEKGFNFNTVAGWATFNVNFLAALRNPFGHTPGRR